MKACLLLLAPVLYAQSIEGTLTNSATHAPVAGVKVKAIGPATYDAITDGGGVFRLADLEPGDYSLSFEAAGFLPPRAAQRPIPVDDAPVRVSFELVPYAKLQGRVLYADGGPAKDARVGLFVYPNGGGLMMTADGQGRFTFQPTAGRYVLAAVAPSGVKSVDGEAWAPTYFPRALERAESQSILLKPGAELSGYEIRLRSVRVFRIRGVIRDDVGDPAPAVAAKLVSTEWLRAAEQQAVSAEDGSFEFSAVRVGEWRLVASVKRGDVELKAVESVILSRRDLDDVAIRLAHPFPVQGLVDRDEPRDAEGKRLVTGISLEPDGTRQDLRAIVFHQQDGSFVLKNVYPGRYEIQPLGFKPGYYLESVKLGDREVIGQKVELFEGAPPIRVTYKPDAPRVRAQVEKGAGAFVALVPQDEAFMTDQFIRRGTADADGRCEIGSLRPGDYYVFAFDHVEGGGLYDPAFVRGLLSRAERLHVEKGESPTVQLKVTLWPE